MALSSPTLATIVSSSGRSPSSTPIRFPVQEGDGTITNPTFSPDGRSIAFHSQSSNAIRRVAVSGGAPVTICPAIAPFGMTWDSGGIVVGQGASGIMRCSPNGGAPEQLAAVDEGELAHGPQMLLKGAALLFTIAKASDGPTRWDNARVVVQTMKSGGRKTVVNGGTDARYLRTGHLVYALSGIVFAVAFDAARQEVTGGAVPVIEGVSRPAVTTGVVQFATSTTGTLLYVPGPAGTGITERALALADRAGTVTRLAIPPGRYVHVRASRDGGRLAIGSDDGKDAIVSIQDLAGTSSMRRLTFGGQNRFPIWSPDGQRIAFQSDREGDLGIFSQRADGNGPAERLTRAEKGDAHIPESWSPDGTHVSFSFVKGPTFSLWTVAIADKEATPYGAVESREPIGSVFSPDGRWIGAAQPRPAPWAEESRPAEACTFSRFRPPVRTFRIPKQRQLDFHPVWGPKGAELIVRAVGRVRPAGCSERHDAIGRRVRLPSEAAGPSHCKPPVQRSEGARHSARRQIRRPRRIERHRRRRCAVLRADARRPELVRGVETTRAAIKARCKM